MLVDFHIPIDTISMRLPIVRFKGSQVEISLLILANSADPDEMQHYAAFHLGLHFLSKYPLRGFHYTKG